MKTTKRVRMAMLSMMALLVGGVVAVLACGPGAVPEQQTAGDTGGSESVSAPATEAPFVLQQSGDGSGDGKQPTATPYPDDCKKKWNLGTEKWEIVCPPPGSRKIDHNLRRFYHDHMEEKATRQARGESVEILRYRVVIGVSTHDAVDAVHSFLQERTDYVIWKTKDEDGDGRLVGHVDVELLPAIAEMEGVEYIDYVVPAAPASLMRQSGTPTPTMTAVERVRADQWHDAGVTGSGVQVAVIDFDFRDFRTRIVDPAVVNADPNEPDVNFLCYYAGGRWTHTDFSACERPHDPPRSSPHGTDVTAALLENAPDVQLYISNAQNELQLEQAVDWLTLKDGDNRVGDAEYDRASNNDFDVKVINYSQTHTWDGPGDGTSPFVGRGESSSLNILNDAVGRGVAWISAAGNDHKSTWFSPNPPKG